MKKNPHLKRQQQLHRLLKREKLNALALNPGPDLSYLTGLDFHLMERPVLGLFSPKQDPVFVLPELEMGKLADLSFPTQTFPYSEDRSTWPQTFQDAFQQTGLQRGRVGVIPRRLRVLELQFLEAAASSVDFVDGQKAMSALRILKDQHEIKSMQKAANIAQQAFQAIRPLIKPGITEKEMAAALVGSLYDAGSDPGLPFFPIVSFGSNSANPHAAPTDRPLDETQIVLIDWGATVDGYYSDITRTWRTGNMDKELLEIARVVQIANQAGREAVQPGILCSEVDRCVREVIENSGYGEYFIHRTGHGLGREAHEEPYIASDDHTPLKAGMTFTIEPGIYLPGRGGVRIEDDILVTEEGCRSFTDLPRELRVL